MGYCFSLVNSLMTRIADDLVTITASEDFIRRRFGVSSSGTTVSYNMFGEPVDLTADIYINLSFEASIKRIELVNDEDSVIGGRPDNMKERIEVYFDSSLDIKTGDTIQRVLTGEWYVIKKVITTAGGTFTYFVAFSEVRSTK